MKSTTTPLLRAADRDRPMARRSLAANIQAVRYEPRLSWLCSCSAEMPLECVAIRNQGHGMELLAMTHLNDRTMRIVTMVQRSVDRMSSLIDD
jgi:hypothetical protein